MSTYHKPRKSFPNSPKFQSACDDILAHEDCTPETHKFIQSVQSTCARTGFVSERQAACVGGAYKKVVNNGVYIKHDWW